MKLALSPALQQPLSNGAASKTNSTANTTHLSTAKYREEKERIYQTPESQTMEAAIQILAN